MTGGALHAGRVAVVTGAATGLGRAYAERLAADGARVAVTDVADPGDAVAAITAAGGEAIGVTCDVASPEGVAAMADEVARRLGPADLLVNNAGISPNVPWDELDFETWRRVLSINLDGQFLTAKALVPGMREGGWGRIVNISSNTFGMVIPGFSHYTASKGGVIGFTRALATDLGPWGITVNAVAPGLTRTQTTETMWAGTDMFEQVAAGQAIKRPGEVTDLAGVVSFLCSEPAGFVTGQTIVVDGGLVRH